jgi:hypothetical protein
MSVLPISCMAHVCFMPPSQLRLEGYSGIECRSEVLCEDAVARLNDHCDCQPASRFGLNCAIASAERVTKYGVDAVDGPSSCACHCTAVSSASAANMVLTSVMSLHCVLTSAPLPPPNQPWMMLMLPMVSISCLPVCRLLFRDG